MNLQQVVSRLGATDKERADALSALAIQKYKEFQTTGLTADIDSAVRCAQLGFIIAPDNCPDQRAWLNNLGVMLGSQYERTGSTAVLEEAIVVAQHVAESTPEDHPDRATSLNNLGYKLYQRYKRTGKMTDMEEAVMVARQAVGSISEDHPNGASCLNNLGITLESRYDRTDEMVDLEEAIIVTRQAIEWTPEGHPDRIARLNNLGAKLGRRHRRTGRMADLEEAIVVIRQAVELAPNGDPKRAVRLNNLGAMLETRSRRTGEIGDLEEAIMVLQQAVESLPKDHPDRASWSNNLGIQFNYRYELTGRVADLEEASKCFRNAWSCQTANSFDRIGAAAHHLKLLGLQRKFDVAIPLGESIINLQPSINGRLLNRSDQQFVRATFAGIAANLCTFLLISNRPIDALQYLEKGRATIVSQLIDSRSDVSALAQQCPDLARRYEKLRDEVNTPLDSSDGGVTTTQVVSRRREVIGELDACVQEIRGIAGQERFLLGHTTAEIQACAVKGTIVVVNITKFRSDAILISSTSIETLSLPLLLAEDAEAWLSKKWTGPVSGLAQKNKEYLKYLAWLWEVCVRQILDEIECMRSTVDRLPRIWWIGTGLGSSMPFHAAGIYSPDSTENAIGRAISSYTPSIKALAYAQHRAKATDNTRGSLLITTMPTTPKAPRPSARQFLSMMLNTPGHIPQLSANPFPDLCGVTDEKQIVMEATNGRMPIEALDSPSVDQIVNSLRACSIAHFACHGSTNHTDPSSSGLVLQKRGEGNEAEQDWLTVNKISELNLTHARIAYLSACSTAEIKAVRLWDEVIHVVSGFQVAGFPHVIGCLWPSNDGVCVKVAGGFYESLLRRGTMGRDGRDVASALRDAVMAVRRTERKPRPLAWAQFVHYGA